MDNVISQQNRLFYFDSPLGEDTLLVNKFSGTEKMSELFHFELELVSADFTIQTEQMLGRNVTVGIRHLDGQNFRYFNGHVSKFAPVQHDGRLAYYHAEMVPWLWFLSLTQGCHIYQEMTLVEVIQKTFERYGYQDYNFNVTDRHKPWENCCQYQESAFAFVSRLLEIEGMYYFFRHEKGKHTLMIVDHMSKHTPCPDQSTYYYEHQVGEGALRREDTIFSSNLRKVVKPNKYAHKDYNFKIPQNPLEITKFVERDTGVDRELEVYDYPGEYELPGDVTDWGDLRMEEQEHDHTMAEGTGSGRSMLPGYRFQLKAHDRTEQNIDYLLVSVTHKGQEGSFVAGADAQIAEYSNSYVAMPSSVQFRPTMKTDEPKIASTQTAFVVGPPGEEIYTDEWGRVRVKFHWDRRPGDENGNSSCWIRVMQPWAGPYYGQIWIPRVGMEVVITFLDGDPDRPLITGCVYHQNNRPPYPLPANKEWNGIKTRSTKGGTVDNYNEIRLVDSIGNELFRMQAEKDLHIFVKNDRSEYILHDRFLDVGGDKHERIDGTKYTGVAGDSQESVDGDVKVKVGGDATLSVGGDQTEEIDGDKSITIDGDQTEEVQGDKNMTVDGDFSEDIQGDTSIHNGGDYDHKVDGDGKLTAAGDLHIKASGKLVIEADGDLTVKAGDAFIKIADGIITIQGKKIMLNCGGSGDDAEEADPDDPDTPDGPDDFDNPDDPRFTSPAGDFPLPDVETPEADASTGDGADLIGADIGAGIGDSLSDLGFDVGPDAGMSGGTNPYAEAETFTGSFDPSALGTFGSTGANPWIAQGGILGQVEGLVESMIQATETPAAAADSMEESQVSGTPSETPEDPDGGQGVA